MTFSTASCKTNTIHTTLQPPKIWALCVFGHTYRSGQCMIVTSLKLQCAADLPSGRWWWCSVLCVHWRLGADAHQTNIFVDNLTMQRYELEAANWCEDGHKENYVKYHKTRFVSFVEISHYLRLIFSIYIYSIYCTIVEEIFYNNAYIITCGFLNHHQELPKQ